MTADLVLLELIANPQDGEAIDARVHADAILRLLQAGYIRLDLKLAEPAPSKEGLRHRPLEGALSITGKGQEKLVRSRLLGGGHATR